MKLPVMPLLPVPVIETQRLRLRGHQVGDVAAMLAMWGDPEVTRYLNTPPLHEEDCWGRLYRYCGHWGVMGYGYWVVEEWKTGKFVGEAGFADYHRQVDPPTEMAPEVGWVLARAYHGKGYGTEIAQAVIGWGREHFGKEISQWCLVHPEHAASLRVAQKCGFIAKTTVWYKGSPAVLLELPSALESRS